jgi:hypothetical protein
MADQISTATKLQFADSYKLFAQQMLSKAEAMVRVEQVQGAVDYIDYIGLADEPEQRQTYVAATNLTEIPHGRRQIVCAPYDKAVPLSDVALKRIIADPTGDYMRVMLAAVNRMKDKKLFAAAIGNSVSVSTDLMTTTNLPLDATQKIVESGTAGMSIIKVGTASTQFNLNEIPKEFERWLFLSPLAIEDLLFEPEVQMSQVHQMALEAIQRGEVKMLFGFNTVMSNYLPKTGNIRSAIAWVREGMALGYNETYYATLEKRPDLWGIYQARNHIDFGATRLQETHVFEIQHYEDPNRGATTPQ